MGGCGFWIGLGQQFTQRSWLYLPSKANGSSPAHACMIMSWASRYLSRVSAGIWPQQNVVATDVPTGKHATSLPPEIVERVGDVHPDRAVLLAEVVGQVRPRHQVEPGEFHGRSSILCRR